MTDVWPKPLKEAVCPIRQDKLEGAADGMGQWGAETRSLHAEGIIPPDLMTQLTIFLLSSQPRDPEQKIPGGGGGIAGGVWVSERCTLHRPLRADEMFTVTGGSLGRHVHKGRRYKTHRSETINAAGELAGSNLTTALLAYTVEEGLADMLEGEDPDQLQPAGPDWSVAGNNPHLDALKALSMGDEFGGDAVLVGLDLMEARGTKNPDNPIHSDPELARKAGLSRPIAGGNHVLAFSLEVLMAQVGRYALLHGASFDIRWKAPVYADMTIFPHVRVVQADEHQVVFDIDATLESDATAMVGQVTVPLV